VARDPGTPLLRAPLQEAGTAAVAQLPLGAATAAEGRCCRQLRAQPVVERVRRAAAASRPFSV